MTDATITIRNLRLRTYIGFKPEELEKKQDVIINASNEVSNAYQSVVDTFKGNVTDYTGMSIYLPGPGATNDGGYLQNFEELSPWQNFVSELTQVGVDQRDTEWWS